MQQVQFSFQILELFSVEEKRRKNTILEFLLQ